MLWLLGCYYISDAELADEIKAHRAALGPIQVSSVEPAWGLTPGGEDVEIAGHGFTDDVEVRFGTALAPITRVTADRLYVEAPAVDGEGPVDVEVSRGDVEGRIEGGYRYWADGTGSVGAVGALWYFQLRGGYWAESEKDRANLYFRVVEPMPAYDYSAWWAAAEDTCEPNPVSPYVAEPYDLAAMHPGVKATVSAQGFEREVAWDDEYTGFVDDDFPVAPFLTTQVWSLDSVTLPDGPEIDTSRLFVTPAAWELTTPRIDGASLTPATLADLDVTWTNPGGTVMLLQLGLEDPGGQGFDAELFCVIHDDGQFTVPASLTADWPAGRQVLVLAGRYVPSAGELAFNHSTVATEFVDWRYGAFVAK